MREHTTRPPRPAPRPREATARRRLLDAARAVFAEKGFAGATGKEICERAGTNTAAVNYYFGGIEELYVAAVQDAHSRLITSDLLAAAVASHSDPQAKLAALIETVIRALTSASASAAVLHLIGREVVPPSPRLRALREKEIPARAAILKGIVSELMNLPADHPAVARACLSIVGPFFMLMVADRRIIKRAFRALGLETADAEVLIQHMIRFSLAGLSAVAGELRKKS
jgi:TetR/AcrR family transcriptional regulator, regulator of cefoperazone and chloramphenicol sensitivity